MHAVDKDSISIRLVHQALHEALQRGLPTALYLGQAGIPQELMQAERARVPAAAVAKLWATLADAMDDEFFGMDSHPMKRGSYRLMCHAVLSCETLGHALHRMLDFLRAVLDDLHGSLRRDGSLAVISVHHDGPPLRMFTYATWLMLIHGLACWLVGRRLPLLSASFRCPEPVEVADYRTRFCEAATFEAAATEIALEARWLDLRVVQSEASVGAFLRGAPANLLVRYRNEASLSAQVRRRLRRLAPADWPDLEQLAQSLHLSDTTLQRRLQAEGLSYQGLKDALRCDLAIDLLSQTEHPVAEVAAQLGFIEPSAFHRAFKKWTGATPGAYRRQRPTFD